MDFPEFLPLDKPGKYRLRKENMAIKTMAIQTSRRKCNWRAKRNRLHFPAEMKRLDFFS